MYLPKYFSYLLKFYLLLFRVYSFLFSFYSNSKKWMVAMVASVSISSGMYIATLVGLTTDATINVPMDVSIIYYILLG